MRKVVDWEAIEREFRAGQLSVSEIGRSYGVSHTAINKRAKRDGWSRDLTARVRQEVSARLVSPEVSEANAKVAIDTAAMRAVEVIRQHRHDISRGRSLTLRLLDELDAVTTHVGKLQEMIETETAEEKTSQRRSAMMRAVELPSRAGVIKDLSTAAKNWVALERQAFNLDDDGGVADDPATKGDVKSALTKLSQSQRDSLRSIATAIVGSSSGPTEGA